MDAETWLMADDALAMGLVDTIISSERDIKMPQNKSQKEMAMIYNKIINPKKEMKDVTNKLGLKNDVSEDVIVSSINELQNEAEDLAKMLKEAKDANEVLENKLKVIEEAEVAKKEKEILDMVENHIKEGRAEESSKNELIEASNKAGFDFVNSMLSKVGSKKSVKVTDKIKATNGGTSLSYIELSKKNPAKLMEIKNSDPALYKQLFDAHYNK
jgi:enoyl-CoA hydratase/carnithine racemase